MLTRNNKVCHTCSTEYKYCTGCSEYDHLPRWMALFHNDNCRKIFNIISSYNVNHITKEEAAMQLNKCDLSYKNEMKSNIIAKIDEILAVNNSKESEKNSAEDEALNNESQATTFTWIPPQPVKRTDVGDTLTGEEVTIRKRPTRIRSKNMVEE